MRRIKKVIFCVGPAHPLYQKPVLAEIQTGYGYNGKQIYGKTIGKVYYPENPKGTFRFDKDGKFLGYVVAEACCEYHEGYCDIAEFNKDV